MHRVKRKRRIYNQVALCAPDWQVAQRGVRLAILGMQLYRQSNKPSNICNQSRHILISYHLFSQGVVAQLV